MSGFFGGGGGVVTAQQTKKRVSQFAIDGKDGTTFYLTGTDIVGGPGSAPGFGAATATQGPFHQRQAGAATSSGLFFRQQARVGRNTVCSMFISLGEVTIAGRSWLGLSDFTNLATQPTTDNPAGNYAAVRFSKVASLDTTFKFITKDNTTQNIVDTGITPVANTEYRFIITDAGSSWTLTDNTTGLNTVVATSSANLPLAGTNLGMFVDVHNPTGAGTMLFNVHQLYMESDI